MTQTFIGSYEDYAKAKVAAAKHGWNDGESVLEYVEAHDHQSARAFGTKDEAVAWVIAAVNAKKTFFGAGDVVTIQETPRPSRCRYCICNGNRPISRAIVTDEGIEEEIEINHCCGE